MASVAYVFSKQSFADQSSGARCHEPERHPWGMLKHAIPEIDIEGRIPAALLVVGAREG
jgi:hypothetical protein